jgi:hypothetical protein
MSFDAARFTAWAREYASNEEHAPGGSPAELSQREYQGLIESFRSLGTERSLAAAMLNDVSPELREHIQRGDSYQDYLATPGPRITTEAMDAAGWGRR